MSCLVAERVCERVAGRLMAEPGGRVPPQLLLLGVVGEMSWMPLPLGVEPAGDSAGWLGAG